MSVICSFAAAIARLRQLAEQDPQGTQTRELLLTLREIQDAPDTAARLIAELRQIEGENGLAWRFHQASAWFASPAWRSKQQDITALLPLGQYLHPTGDVISRAG